MSEEPTDLGTNTPWDDIADLDLRSRIGDNQSIEEIADLLCRSEAEVRARIFALGLEEPENPRPWPVWKITRA